VKCSKRDVEDYFKTAFSSVHQMALTLEKKGFISRIPGTPRSTALRLMRA